MPRRIFIPLIVLFVFIANPGVHSVAQDDATAEASTKIKLAECLVLPSVARYARSPVHIDALEALMLGGDYAAPKTGDVVKRADGQEVAWKSAKADEKGWLAGGEYRGANAFWNVPSDTEQMAVLHAIGHSSVYANGELRQGDPYGFGNVRTPVKLRKGDNHFLFRISRGRLKATLELLGNEPVKLKIGSDWTLPDLMEGPQSREIFGAVDVINTTDSRLEVIPMVRGLAPAFMNERFAGPKQSVPAMSCRKLEFPIPVFGDVKDGEYRFEIKMVHAQGESIREANTLASAEFKTPVVDATKPRRVTFRSDIDGSVQYYGLRPAVPLVNATEKPGILLSLHGAGVEGIGQARAYSPKSWCHIVCPTNRRKFGFDWEDWGRLDALEVLAHAKQTLSHEPTKVWLAGHSMGGHGTWTVGAHFPDKFAAIAPSAGWESFFSYTGGPSFDEKYSVSDLLTRSMNPSRTLLRKHNYSAQGVYILHGDADDNVPVTEARNMRDALKPFHRDLQYFEQPGAGHWWDDGHDKGADCLDWQPMFDMFTRRRLPHISEVQRVDFTTVCPEHSASSHWATIEMQSQQLAPSRVQIELYPNKGKFNGSTENVTRMSLQVGGVISKRDTVSVTLDGTELRDIAWPADGRIHLRLQDDAWQVDAPPSLQLKGPHRYGWFKNALKHRFVLVYGTMGTASENAWSFQKARYDAEQWWYRGNGSVELIADSDFKPSAYANRGVVVYGNSESNSAYDALVGSRLSMSTGKITIGDHGLEADDIAAVFSLPRLDSDTACVAVVGGTGIKGMRLTDKLGYFVSGASFPDLMLFDSQMLKLGTGGVRAVGYFGEDWSIAKGEFVFSESKEE